MIVRAAAAVLLTLVPTFALAQPRPVPEAEVQGVNDRAQLAAAEADFQKRRGAPGRPAHGPPHARPAAGPRRKRACCDDGAAAPRRPDGLQGRHRQFRRPQDQEGGEALHPAGLVPAQGHPCRGVLVSITSVLASGVSTLAKLPANCRHSARSRRVPTIEPRIVFRISTVSKMSRSKVPRVQPLMQFLLEADQREPARQHDTDDARARLDGSTCERLARGVDEHEAPVVVAAGCNRSEARSASCESKRRGPKPTPVRRGHPAGA